MLLIIFRYKSECILTIFRIFITSNIICVVNLANTIVECFKFECVRIFLCEFNTEGNNFFSSIRDFDGVCLNCNDFESTFLTSSCSVFMNNAPRNATILFLFRLSLNGLSNLAEVSPYTELIAILSACARSAACPFVIKEWCESSTEHMPCGFKITLFNCHTSIQNIFEVLCINSKIIHSNCRIRV